MDRLYVIVRSDISAGLQVAQSCHAMAAFASEHPAVTSLWHTEGNNLVCLQANSEQELLQIADHALAKGALVSKFEEPDLNGETTAIAISGEAKALLRKLPLTMRAA